MSIKAVVKDCVVDLRKEPNTQLVSWKKDPLELSQLLLGEKVHILSEKEGWSYVEVLQQHTCTSEGELNFYKGYVANKSLLKVDTFYEEDLVVLGRHNELSIGTRLKSIREMDTSWEVLLPGQESREISKEIAFSLKGLKEFKEVASLFLGFPYLWGGRSSFCEKQHLRSVDCSGFVHLVYSILGHFVPRDSKDQFFFENKNKKHKPLKENGLVFLSKTSNPRDIFHVMMIFDHEHLIESCEARSGVSIVSIKERLGKNLEDLKWAEEFNNEYIFWHN